MNIPDDMRLLFTTPNSTIYGNERTVIKQFSPLTMHYVKSGHIRSPKEEAEIQQYAGEHVIVPKVISYSDDAIVMERLPYIFAGKMFDAQLMKELAVSLQNIHNAGYVHTDIKRRNLGLDAQGDMSILDWNGATKIGDTQTLPQYTPKYSALELKFGGEVYPQTDMYSMACIAYRAFGKTLTHTKVPNLDNYIDQGTDNWENRRSYVDFIEQCTRTLPEERPESLDKFIEICDAIDRPFRERNVEEENNDTYVPTNYN